MVLVNFLSYCQNSSAEVFLLLYNLHESGQVTRHVPRFHWSQCRDVSVIEIEFSRYSVHTKEAMLPFFVLL